MIYIGSWTVNQKDDNSELFAVFDFKQQVIYWYTVDISLCNQQLDATKKGPKNTGELFPFR